MALSESIGHLCTDTMTSKTMNLGYPFVVVLRPRASLSGVYGQAMDGMNVIPHTAPSGDDAVPRRCRQAGYTYLLSVSQIPFLSLITVVTPRPFLCFPSRNLHFNRRSTCLGTTVPPSTTSHRDLHLLQRRERILPTELLAVHPSHLAMVRSPPLAMVPLPPQSPVRLHNKQLPTQLPTLVQRHPHCSPE